MDETDRGPNRIDQVNRATVGNVNAQANSALVRNGSVAVGETLVRGKRRVNDGDLFPVDLLRSDKRFFSQAMLVPNLAMNFVQPRERLGFVVRHPNSRNAQRETVNEFR